MATKIRIRRRTNNALNTGVVLAAGEPYYNTTSKNLYIGNNDTDAVDAENKKHIAQITPLDKSNSNNIVSFQVGEDPRNVYTQEISNVPNARTAEQLVNWKSSTSGNIISFSFGPNNEYGLTQAIGGDMDGTITSAKDVTDTIGGVPISSYFDSSHKAWTAVRAEYTPENENQTIESRLCELSESIANLGDSTSSDFVATGDNIDKFREDLQTGVITVATAAHANSSQTSVSAKQADVASNLENLSLESSSEATIRLTWGPKSEHSTSFTVSGESIGGTVTSAENVTKSINGNAITDIFESDGKVVKKATAATYTEDNLEKTISERLEEVATSVNDYIVGTKISTFAKYAQGDSTNTIHDRIEAVRRALANLETTVGAIQNGAASNIAELNNTVESILNGSVTVGDLSNLRLTAEGTTLTLSWGDNKTSSATVSVEVGGSVDSANSLTNSRKIELTGDVTGYTLFDGSSDVTITATVADDSHNHTIANVDGLQSALDSKASAGNVYTKSETDTLLTAKASASHNHDDVYFTESEVTSKLAGKANVNHSHTEYALTAHTHDGIYAPANHTHEGIASNDHNHDSRYYTETEVDQKLATKADSEHTHNNYSLTSHTHNTYANISHNHDNDYADISHSHDDYADVEHNHDNDYAGKTHTHPEYVLEWKSF